MTSLHVICDPESKILDTPIVETKKLKSGNFLEWKKVILPPVLETDKLNVELKHEGIANKWRPLLVLF